MYLTWRPHKDVQETVDFLSKCLARWETGEAYEWVIERKRDSEMLGMILLEFDDAAGSVGYIVARDYWGKGYGSEALRGVLDFAFSIPHIDKVWAGCDLENTGSAKVMEKVGMQCKGILRRYIILPNRSDKPRDCYYYTTAKR